jgi:hypothetical protein
MEMDLEIERAAALGLRGVGREADFLFGMRNGVAFPRRSITYPSRCKREKNNGLALSHQPVGVAFEARGFDAVRR